MLEKPVSSQNKEMVQKKDNNGNGGGGSNQKKPEGGNQIKKKVAGIGERLRKKQLSPSKLLKQLIF